MDNKEIQVLIDQNKRQAERMDDMRNQLDRDRASIDQIIIDLSNNTKVTETMLKQIEDFKTEIRQTVTDAIAIEIPKIVKKEIRLLAVNNPEKEVKGHVDLLERVKTLLNNLRK